jgi:YVTN family beta-propeller protein
MLRTTSRPALAWAVVILVMAGFSFLAVSPRAPVHSEGPAELTGSESGHAAADSVVATIPINSGATEGTFDPANGYVYIPTGVGYDADENTSNVTVISGTSNTVVTQLFSGINASQQTPTYVPSNQEIYVANQNNTGNTILGSNPTRMDNVTAYSSTDAIVANIGTGFESTPNTPVYDPANNFLYVSDSDTLSFAYPYENVSVINAGTNTLVKQIVVGYGPLTGAYDPADGDIYVPNNDEDNLSIINATSNTVIATIGGLQNPYTPAYDPVNQEVYVPNGGGYNITVLKGTAVVTTIALPAVNADDIGFAPTVDPSNGEVFFALTDSNTMAVISPSNTFTEIGAGTGSYGAYQCTYDPADGDIYAPGLSEDGSGGILVIDAATNSLVETITVGDNPQTPTYDSNNNDVYVPNEGSPGSVSVIGSSATTSKPGTYSVTFTETGLPSGAWWQVTFNGSALNQTTSAIVVNNLPNDTYAYSLDAWYSESTCTFTLPSKSGSITVAGKDTSMSMPFSCSSSTPSPSGSGSAASGFLGLPGDDGYFLIAGIIAAFIVVSVLVITLRRPKAGAGTPAPPPGSPYPQSPPPYAPPPPPPP